MTFSLLLSLEKLFPEYLEWRDADAADMMAVGFCVRRGFIGSLQVIH